MQERGLIGALTFVLSYLSNCTWEILIVLSLLMMIDWVTGVILAIQNERFSAEKGAWGAFKKLLYILIILVAYLADLTIFIVSQKLGMGFNTHGAFGFAVTFYLIGNEGISIYANANRLGLPVPQFLSDIFNNFKLMAKTSVKSTEKSTNKQLKEGEKNGEDGNS